MDGFVYVVQCRVGRLPDIISYDRLAHTSTVCTLLQNVRSNYLLLMTV